MDACGELKITTTYGEKNVITCALAVDLKSFFGHLWLRHSWPEKLFKMPAKARVMKFFHHAWLKFPIQHARPL